MKYLDKIKQPADVKKLDVFQLKQLAREVRKYLIDVTSVTGGHLSSNLGVVELTLMLHHMFDSPTDKIIWDVGHQAYVHKLLSGRIEEMKSIRQFGGISGFPKKNESEHDIFEAGHSSTSISAGIGMAAARDIKGGDHYVVSVIGDGALTGGMAYEALHNGSKKYNKFIVVLNDNQMSIDKNVGGMAMYLDKFRTGHLYNEVKSDVEHTLSKIPRVGNTIVKTVRGVKNGVKQLLVPGMFFEELGYTYLGPIDGHDLQKLKVTMEQAKSVDGPVLLHVMTVKGKGYGHAEKDPLKFHGVKPFDKQNGVFHAQACDIEEKEPSKSYSSIVGETLTEIAAIKPNVVGITAAMCSGTGLSGYASQFPERFFDVGIAEQHAVTFAAGLANDGIKPFFMVYSSFLQRAYDQVLHDVCIQKLPVVFCLDRAGLVGEDGETHQGVFDLSFLSHIPNMTVLAPKSGTELKEMMHFAAAYNAGPIAIRYPKGLDNEVGLGEPIEYGQPEWIKKKNRDILLISVGSFYERVAKVRVDLKNEGLKADMVNLRFVAPIDEGFIKEISEQYKHVYVFEDNMLNGGVTSIISRRLASLNAQTKRSDSPTVYGFGIDDEFVTHGKVSALEEMLGLSAEAMFNRILELELG